MSLAARQALLARFLAEPSIEQAVRADPVAEAARYGVDAAFARWLAGLAPGRVQAFRRSRVHKDAVRAGRPPTRLR